MGAPLMDGCIQFRSALTSPMLWFEKVPLCPPSTLGWFLCWLWFSLPGEKVRLMGAASIQRTSINPFVSLILCSDWYDCHKLWLSNSNGYCHQIDSIPNSVFNCLCILWWSIICANKNFHISILCVASISPKISNNPQCLVQQRLKLKARNNLKQCAHLDIVLFFKVFPKDSRFYFFASGLCFFSSWRDVFPWHVFAWHWNPFLADEYFIRFQSWL